MSKKTAKKKATPKKKAAVKKHPAKAPEKKRAEKLKKEKADPKPKMNGKPPQAAVPVEAHYDLKKVTLETDLGVTVNWTELPQNATSNAQDEISKTYAAIPHPDLILAMGKLKYALLRSTGHLDMDRERKPKFNQQKFEYEPEEIKAWETLEKRIDIIHADKLVRTTITSLTISTKEDSVIFNIQGKYKTDSGAVISLNSPQISSQSESFGCEDEVYQHYKNIFKETWKYQFENKHAEAVTIEPAEGLFAQNGEPTEEEKEPVEQD